MFGAYFHKILMRRTVGSVTVNNYDVARVRGRWM
jgi:hypothetical protein